MATSSFFFPRRQPSLHHHFRHQQPPFISFQLFPPPFLFPVAHHSNTHTSARSLLFLLGCHHHRSMHTHQHSYTHLHLPSPWLFHDHLVRNPHPVSNFLSRHPKPETPPSLSTVETRKKRKEWVFRPLSSSDQPHSLSHSASRNSPSSPTSGLTEKHHKHPCFSVLVYLIHAHADRKTHTSRIYTLWYPPISPVVSPYLTLSRKPEHHRSHGVLVLFITIQPLLGLRRSSSSLSSIKSTPPLPSSRTLHRNHHHSAVTPP